jgi:hypothetical protein
MMVKFCLSCAEGCSRGSAAQQLGEVSAERDMEANNLCGGVRALLRAGGVGGLGGAVMASSRQRSASGPRCASQAIAERDDKEANNRGGDVRALLRAGGLGGTVLVSSRQRSASGPRCAPRGSVTSAPRGSVTNSVRPSASMPVAAGRAGEEGAKCCSCCRAVVIEWVRVWWLALLLFLMVECVCF